MTVSYTYESDTPSNFNVSIDDVPQRNITDFVVTCGADKVSICSLDDKASTDTPVIVKGTLTAPDGSTLKVVSNPLTEWCIEYSQSDPRLWVRSRHTWYRLSKPAKEYARVHDLARRRFELCARIYILLLSLTPGECTFKDLAHLLSFSYYEMKGYSEKEILSEKSFILSQFRNFNESSIAESTFLRELKSKKVPVSKKIVKPKKESISVPSSPVPNGRTAPYDPVRPTVELDAEGNEKLLKQADKALANIMKQRLAYPFVRPVNPKLDCCPDYLDRISTPMDYGTIKNRLENNFYSSVSDVVADFQLVTRNCIQYNSAEHEYSKWAMNFQNKFESLIRNAEDAEIASMSKRNGKKRRASGDLPPSGKSVGKKGSKVSRKGSKTSSDLSPTVSSPSKDEDVSSRPCARSEQGCEKFATTKSKYCSDTCGFIIAKQRLDEIYKSGCNPEEYIRTHITKVLVQSRS